MEEKRVFTANVTMQTRRWWRLGGGLYEDGDVNGTARQAAGGSPANAPSQASSGCTSSV